MTVTAQISSAQYAGNGVTTNFPWTGFRIDTASELQVVLINNVTFVETPTINFTATGFGNDAGGNVVYPAVGSPLAVGTSIRIQRIVPYQQNLDISVESGFSPEVVEQQLDKMVMMIQQLARGVAQIAGGSISGVGALPITGGTISPGPLNISGDVKAQLGGAVYVDNVAGTKRSVFFSTSGLKRWEIYTGVTAESGANAGSTFRIDRYDDAGVLIDNVINIGRSSGSVTVNKTDNNPAIGGPTFLLNRFNSGTADGGFGPQFNFDAPDSALTEVTYVQLRLMTETVLAGACNARLDLRTVRAGSLLSRFHIGAGFYSFNVTGGDKGGDTINVKDYFDDGVNINTLYSTISGTDNTHAAGQRNTFQPSATKAGLNVGPDVIPSALVDGDVISTSTSFLLRINGQTARLMAEQYMILSANYTMVSQTAAQKAFNVGTSSNGAFNAKGSTTYEFEGFINIDTMNAASGAFGFALAGTAVTSQVEYDTVANKAALATAAAPQNTVNVGTTLPVANTAVVTATTNTVGWMRIKGTVRVTTAGTLIPQVSLGVANAARILAGSYFKFWPLGDNNVTTQGDIA